MTNKKPFDIDDIEQYSKDIKQSNKLDKPFGMGAEQSQNEMIVNSFPIHLYPPRGCETFDDRASFNLSAPTISITIVNFRVPNNTMGFWRSYSLFSDAPKGVTTEFIIKVNGSPALKYHGSSVNNFKKTLALGNDLQGEIDALVELKGGDLITIEAIVSSSAIPVTVAARVKGWLMSAGTTAPQRVGS